jgi:hypothetical protein
MATQDYAASVQGVTIRVTRLNPDATLATGANDSYTTSAFIRLSFTPEYEEGDEITEKSANGVICVSYKAPDTLKRVTMEIAICEPDPEFTHLVSNGVLLTKTVSGTTKSVGFAAPYIGEDPAGYGVAVEVWSYAVAGGKRVSDLPYFHWVFPYARLRPSGDRVIENGMLATTFEGYGLGNILFAQGIDGRWNYPDVTDRPFAYARTTWAPIGLKGFYTWSSSTGTATAVSTITDVADSVDYTVAPIPDSIYESTVTAPSITGVTATATASTGATGGAKAQIAWTLSSDGNQAPTYTIKYSTSTSATLVTAASSVKNQPYTVTGLNAGTYYFNVVAVNEGGSTSASASSTALS